MNRTRIAAGLAVMAATTLVLTVGVHPTFASWVSRTDLGDAVGVASSSCTTPAVYRTTASGRFLAGSVAGVPLTSVSALAPMTADNPATTATFPAGATPRGSDAATTTVTNAAVASAVPALTAPSGSQTQYAGATSTGRSTAGAGAVTTAGAIDTAGIAGGTRATVGAVDISSALAAVSGGTAAAGSLSQLGLSIGDAGSVASLNECARRWGASLSSALTRSTTVSSLSLSTKDAALTTLLGSIAAQRATVATAFSGVAGTSGTSAAATSIATTAKSGLAGALSATLSALGLSGTVGTPTATVTITPDTSAVAAAATGTTTAGSGLVSLDGSTGLVTTDLAKLADPTSPAPNTAVLTAADAATIASGVGTAAGTLVGGVGTAWDGAVANAVISVDVAVPVTALGIPILNVEQTMTGTVADFLSPTHVWAAPTVTILGAIQLGPLLAALLPQLSALLLGPVQAAVGSAVATPLTTAVTTAKAALAASLATARAAMPGDLARLATLLSITLNEQPDVAPFPTAAAGTGSGYRATALRVRVASGAVLDLAVATVSVGPDRTINE